MGPENSPDIAQKRKISTPDYPALTLVTILTEILWLPDTAVRNQYYLASLTILEK
jgi:hypothetical protein